MFAGCTRNSSRNDSWFACYICGDLQKIYSSRVSCSGSCIQDSSRHDCKLACYDVYFKWDLCLIWNLNCFWLIGMNNIIKKGIGFIVSHNSLVSITGQMQNGRLIYYNKAWCSDSNDDVSKIFNFLLYLSQTNYGWLYCLPGMRYTLICCMSIETWYASVLGTRYEGGMISLNNFFGAWFIWNVNMDWHWHI